MFANLFSVLNKCLFDGSHVDIFLSNNIEVVESVLTNLLSKKLKVRFDVMEVSEAKLLWVPVFIKPLVSSFVYSRAPSDERVVEVSENEALTFVRGKGRKCLRHGFLLAEHV